MKKSNFIYLNHVLTCIYYIEEYSKDKDYDGLVKNHMLQDSLIRQIEIIGEATSRITKDFKDKYNEIPWLDMKDMRNKLIHDYFGVNIKYVWNVINQDIPFLKKQITKILNENNIQIKLGFE